MSKKAVGWVVVILVIIGLVWAFTGKKEVVQSSPIKIGASLALTGKLAYVGIDEQNGLTLAIEEINAQGGIGGKKLELSVEDNQGDAQVAATSINKLLSVDGSDIIFSAFTNVVQAIKGAVIAAGKPMIYASTVRSIAQESPLIFVDYYDAIQQGTVVSDAVLKAGYSKVQYLGLANDACKVFEQSVVDQAKNIKVTITNREQIDPSSTDIRTSLLKLRQSGEPIVMCTYDREQNVMKQLKEIGMIETPTFHFAAPFLPAANTPEIVKLFAENKTFSSWYGFTYDQMNSNPKLKKFVENYRARFKMDPSPAGAYAYDDVFALKEALKACQVSDSACIGKELIKVKLDGAAGPLSFDANRASVRNTLMMRNVDGEWRSY